MKNKTTKREEMTSNQKDRDRIYTCILIIGLMAVTVFCLCVMAGIQMERNKESSDHLISPIINVGQ